jgi:hypothetical protein
MGQKATLQSDRRISALPLRADICQGDDHVCLRPTADSCTALLSRLLSGEENIPLHEALDRIAAQEGFGGCQSF